MKSFKLIIILQIFIVSLFAQSVPQGMNYQAVARDAKGEVLANQDISLQIQLTAGPDGKVLYSEIHDITTNQLGLFDVIIGQGFPQENTFDQIKWSENEIWMDMALEEDGNYTSLGNSKLWTVPYAMHAGSAESIKGANAEQKSGAKWSMNGNTVYAPLLDKLGSSNNQDVIIITNNTERMRWKKDGDINISNNLDVAEDVTASTYYGDGSNLTGINVNDADSDPTNELQNWSNLPGIPVNIDTDATDDFSGSFTDLSNVPAGLADGDDVNDADSDPTNELQNWSNLPGIPVNIDTDATDDFSGSFTDLSNVPAGLADGDDVNDADSDPTNELQNWSNLPGIPANIDTDATDDFSGSFTDLSNVPAGLADGDDVNDADNDPTNELQNWSNLPGIPANIDTDATNDFSGSFTDLSNVPAGLADGDDVNDADNDPTNELQNWSNLPGIPADIANGDQVNDADADPTNEIEMPSAQAGDMAFYNGSSWQRIPAGINGQVLTMSNGVPTWVGGDVSSLLQVNLPTGQTLYVNTNNVTNAGDYWGDRGNNIDALTEYATINTAFADYNGVINTVAIVSELQNWNYGYYAAKQCSDLVAHGFDDWYLPSAGELYAMYQQLGPGGTGAITSGRLWSSTEAPDDSNSEGYGWFVNFSNGQRGTGYKGSNAQVTRCVRK